MDIRQVFAIGSQTRAWVCVMSVLGLLMLGAPTYSQAASSRTCPKPDPITPCLTRPPLPSPR